MAHAYTPGLLVSDNVTITKRRILPLKGRVIVKNGQILSPDDVVARTELPGEAKLMNVANMLSIPPEEVPQLMLKKIGDSVQEGEVIGESKSFFGLFKASAKSIMTGTIENISSVTGQVLLRGPSIPVEVKAYINGEVIEIIPEEGCVVRSTVVFIQGIFGIGSETHGELKAACRIPNENLTEEKIDPSFAGKIIIGGARVTAAALKKAISVGAVGVVTGGFDDKDLKDFLGYDLGVAITGTEKLGITLIITEGFGDISMAKRTFEILLEHQGCNASLNGATQIRAGVIRPEVVIPILEASKVQVSAEQRNAQGLVIGSLVRVIRMPYFGRLGVVSELPSEPLMLESGSKARILKVTFEDGTVVIVPRANVELIES